jgi:hypothetical protein
MLALGLHPGTSDAEAQQSMRQAQRLLAKYNLDQATVQQEAEAGGGLRNSGAMAGGLVKVELRKAGTGPQQQQQPAQLSRTAEQLADCCATNFECKLYLVRSRRHTQARNNTPHPEAFIVTQIFDTNIC